jgi:hypothetical protein
LHFWLFVVVVVDTRLSILTTVMAIGVWKFSGTIAFQVALHTTNEAAKFGSTLLVGIFAL